MILNIGLCLCGGGAKGAYQAGVIKALYDRGINKFNSIAGTSIGAINGYFLFTENVDKLEEIWTNINKNTKNGIKIVDNTVDNSDVIEILSKLDDKSSEKMDFYVNYINIDNNIPKEEIVNLLDLNREEALDSIRYSSLLPFNPKGTMGLHNQFINDLSQGLYNGYKLDGGLVNNTLIKPLLDKNFDKIIVIATNHDYILPDEIKNSNNVDNIIIVRPKTIFDKNDTLKFEMEFCKNIYSEGYEIGKNLNIFM
jgi:predicted acylesterase/phospholipase RssA